MFVPLGPSEVSGFYFQYPDRWKDEYMNVQAKRKHDPYMKIGDISAVYDGGNILSSGLSSDVEDPDTQVSSVSTLVSADTLFLHHATKDDGHSKPILRLGDFSRKLILQTIDGINALDKIELTYQHPDDIDSFLSDKLNVPDLQTLDDRITALSSVRLFRPGLCNYVKSLPAVVSNKMAQWAYSPKAIDIGKLYAPMVQSLIQDIQITEPIYYEDLSGLQWLGDSLSSLKDINNMPKWPYNRALEDTAERHAKIDPKYWCRNERKFAMAVADCLPLSSQTKDKILSAENPWIQDLSAGGNPPLLDFIIENYSPDPSYQFVQQKWDVMSYPKKSLIAPILAQTLLMYPYLCGIIFKENSITVPHVRQTHRHRFQLKIDLTKISITEQFPWYMYEQYPVKADAMLGTQLEYENNIVDYTEYDKIDNKFTQANTHYDDLHVVRLHYGTVDVNALIEEGHKIDDDNCVYFDWSELNSHNSNIYQAFTRGGGGSTTSYITYNFEWELKQKKEGEISGTYGGRWPSKAIGNNIESLNVSLVQNSHIQGFDAERKSTECLSKMDDTVTLDGSATWAGALSSLRDVVGKFKQPLDNEYWNVANDWYGKNQIDFKWPVPLNRKETAEIDYAKAYDSKITLSWKSGIDLNNVRCHITHFNDDGTPELWVVECWSWPAYGFVKCLDEKEPMEYENWTINLPEQTPQEVIAGDGSDQQCFKNVDADYKTDLKLMGEFVFK